MTGERLSEAAIDRLLAETFGRPARTGLAQVALISNRSDGQTALSAQPYSFSEALGGAGRRVVSEAELEVLEAGIFGRQPADWAARAVQLHESATLAPAGQVRLLEAATAVRRGDRVRVRVIAPGRGSSGYYSAEMLKRDGPTVFRAGLDVFLDHPTATEQLERPIRSVKDMAGRLGSAAVWEDQGPLGAGLYADVEVFPHHEALVAALGPHIGLSIRAYGEAEYETGPDGITGQTITSLVDAQSIDFVTKAGAGGAVVI